RPRGAPARRCRRRATGILGGRQRQEPCHDFRDRPLDRRAPAGARRGGAGGVKIGLFLALFSDRSLEEALDAALAAGCETVEIMSGPWGPHCPPAELLGDTSAREHLTSLVAERGLLISALSCHANALHPDVGVAAG